MKGMEPNPPPSPSPDLAPVGEERRSIIVIFPTVEPFLTFILLFILATIYLYASSLEPENPFNRVLEPRTLFQQRWAKINELVYEGEYYRLLTSMFLHLNLTHLAVNGLALYLFGREVESLFGHVRFAIIYIMGGLAGSLASLLYTDAPSLGASGAIFALFSAFGVYFYHHRHIYGPVARLRLIQLSFLAAIQIALPEASVDNAAHIGGIIGGFILAWFISPAFEPRQGREGEVIMIDKNTPDQWWFVPLVYGAVMVFLVGYATVTLG